VTSTIGLPVFANKYFYLEELLRGCSASAGQLALPEGNRFARFFSTAFPDFSLAFILEGEHDIYFQGLPLMRDAA
jgi:hypothetical protein